MEIVKEVGVSEKIVKRSISQRVASNFGWSIISEAIGKSVFFITNIYLARVLGVENFGVFTLAQTVTFYLWFAVDLGISLYGTREIAKEKGNAEKIINPLLTLRISSGIVLFFLYMSSLVLIDIPPAKMYAFMGCGLYLLTYSFYSDWILKGLEKFKYIAFGSFVSSALFLVPVSFLVKNGYDVVRASFIWSLSFLFGSLSLLYFLYRLLGIRYRPSFNLKAWLSHVKESIYFSISGVLMTVYQYLPIILLSFFYSSVEVGLFSAPYRVTSAIGAAGFLVPMAFYPVFSEMYFKNRIEFEKTHKHLQKIMLALGLPAGIIGTIWGDEIVGLLFGAQYMQSAAIFKILIWLIPLSFLRYTYGSVLLAAGFQRLHNISTSIGVLCMSITGLFLVQKFSFTGGAVSLLVSEAVILCSMALIFHKKLRRSG